VILGYLGEAFSLLLPRFRTDSFIALRNRKYTYISHSSYPETRSSFLLGGAVS